VSKPNPADLCIHGSTYNWNFGDNTTPISSQTATHTFADNGNYNVVLTVTDKDGGVTTQTVVAKVDNVAPTIVNIVKPDKINEGQSVEFTATATDPGILDTLTYTWNFGDNSSTSLTAGTNPVTGQNVNHIFADNGDYNVVLTVTDKDGGVTTQTVAVKVDNVAPTIINIVKPDKINESQAVEFTAIATDAGINDTLTYSWNFGDNTTPVLGQNVNHTFTDNGNYNVVLTVTDTDGASTTQTVAVKVDNVAPTILSIVKPDLINEGQSVEFKATATDSGINDTLTYSWNFGDNTTPVIGQNVNHTFIDNGDYNVVLTVTDTDGASTTQTVAVKVDNVAPTIVNIVKPTQINEGQSVEFTATATDAGINDTLTYNWNFGDNTIPVLGQNVNHTFADNGNYSVVLTVTDKDGGVTTETVAVKVDNVAPTIVNIVKPDLINEGELVEFKATATDAGINDTLTYTWNFGDSSSPIIGQNATHTFADNGNYNVVLTVTDKDGASTTQSVAVKVDNVAPTIVNIVKPDLINEGESVEFKATATDAGINDTLTYTWNFGDNTTPVTGQNVNHIFVDNGNYSVVLTVTDKDGGVTTQTVVVKVDNVTPVIVNIVKPDQINEGESVEFKATATDAGINDTLTYSWNFGDSTNPVVGQNATHTFADNGNYNVVLTVTDKDGSFTTQTVAVKVDNVAPTIVNIVKPDLINEGQSVEFTATATDAGINDTLTYTWNFGDNTIPVLGRNATHTFADNGNYNVVLTVTDKDGGVTNQTVAVKVDNVAPVIVNIVKPDQINEGESVEFKATATDAGINDTLTYSWNFGDSTNPVLGQNATHTFADNGNYNVVLTVTDKDGAVTTQTVAVKVNNVAPVILSLIKPDKINEGESVEFTATATDAGINNTLTYSWNFGDNTNPVVGQNVNHTFADNGNYNIALTVTDKDGGFTTQTVTVKVDNVAPVIVSIVKPEKINEGQSVEFKATATDPGIKDTLTYSWNFGDSTNPVVGQNVNHTFADNGNYNVLLTVTDKDGATTTQTVAVKVDNVAPTIVNIVKPDLINEGQSVAFTATATDPGILDTLTYNWNFGDNTTAVSGQNVNHTFVDNGNYSVVLTVTDKDGGVTTQTTAVKVDNVAPTIVSIVKPTQINEGQAVAFTATATDPGILDTLTYSWNFGDTTTSVSGQNVNHTFADNGNYNVVLTVTDKDGYVTTQATTVKVDNVAPTIVSITKPDLINEGQAVTFAATATDPGILDPLTYSWNFGDTTPVVSGQNVNHTFVDNGNYNVVLTVTDFDGGVTTQTIVAKVDNVAPTIVNIAKPDLINEGQSVEFKATATDPGIKDTLTYSWNFGDSTTAVSGQNINHTFADNGNYNVVLTVTDKDGGVTTQTVAVKVDNLAPVIVNIVKPDQINEGQAVQFKATATDAGSIDTLTYTWNFGDNTNPVIGQNATHSFADNGNYNVVLTVTDKDGAATTQTVAVKVDNVAPVIVNIVKLDNINEGQAVEFKATATDAGINDTLTYTWNFGDNTNPVIGQNATHTFADNGDYNVLLTVTDKDGAVTTQTVAVKVDNVAPVIVNIVKPTQISEGEAAAFLATANDPGTKDTLTYSWNFGDNTTPVIGQNVNHTFADNGNYSVVLTVTDKDGGVTRSTVAAKVDNVAPVIANITKPDKINEGQVVAFSATATDPGIKDTLTYSWNFGDNTTASVGQSVTHTYADNGNYNVVLTVIDKDGAATTQTVVAKVDNVAPSIVNITKQEPINEGQSVTFAATATDPGTVDTLSYTWNFGDNTTAVVGQSVNHTFADNGNYNVVLTVTDKDGAATTQTVVTKVDNVAPTIVSIAKPTQINEGQSVTFSATATDPGIKDTLTYSWNFGDNTTALSGQSVTHTFADNGNYNVFLTVTDKDGGVTTQTTTVKVDNVAPTIVSIVKPTQINEGQSVTFSATATDPGIKDTLTYSWNFGDSTTAVSGQNVTHTFADNGNYNVVLTVTDKDGGVTTQTTTVKVDNVAPTIVSIAKPTQINEGQSVAFTATATDPGILDTLTYNWNFGDTTTSVSGQNVNHTFADNGNYNVVLTVTDFDGGVTTQTTAVKVDNVAPTIVSIVKPTQINEGQSVTFTATATDPGILDTLTYSWNFGDNTTAVSGQNVNHTFADNGNYNVILTVTDKDGGVTTQTTAVKVDNVAPTIVSIAKPTQINEGQSVAFTATATDPGILDTLTYSWNFGDNTTAVSGQNVNHTFADNGNYNVVLTVMDKDGGVTTQTIVAKVDNVAPTIVSITKPTQINEGQSVEFKAIATDAGINDTLTYSWNFGDNTNPVVGQNVTHTFVDNGNYNVVLTVTDKDAGVTTQTVVAKVDNVAPTIISIAKPAQINEGQSVTFAATATDPGILDTLTYSWNFGDTTTSVSGQNVTHTFADNGNYNVVLTVTDKDGGVTTQTTAVKVDNVAPTIVNIAKPTQINEGQSVEFSATATDLGIKDTLTYSWNFGDNTTAVSGQNVNHTFVDNGNYNVVLTVTDKDGGVTIQTTAAKVDNVAPSIVSIVKPTTINEGQSVAFSATATDPGILDTLTYSWNFGDTTNPVTGRDVTHTFADNGNYTVVLTVTDKDGAIATQTVVAKVDNVAPTIINITKPTTIKEGESFNFAATATDPGILDTLTYSWNFGDTTTSVSGQNVNHTFADNGNYNVVLTVTDKDGGVTTQTTAVKVDNVAPSIVSIVKPTQINEGQAVTFSTTANDPGIKDTLTYSWNFGDNTTAVLGQNVTHTFVDNGNYNVVLTVTDKDGGVTTQTTAVKVDNVVPTIVSIVKPTQINEGQSVNFAATATDPGILDTLTYSWNFGDTTTPVAGQNVTHIFADNGNYNVVLTVTDKDGGVTTQTTVVKVDNVAPVIVSVSKPTQINEGQSITFAATVTDAGINDPLTYSWNFGDSTTPTSGQTTTHTFADNGNYNVVLTVTDKDGGVTTQTVTVKVDNVAPIIASITLPQNVIAGIAAQFAATATDVGTKDTLTYSWNFGDNTTATIGQNATHTFTSAGTYSIVLTVTDKDGGTTTQTQSITIAAPPTTSGIRSGGTVTISGSANLDGNVNSRTDDTHIYAAKGVNLNGNITLPVKRDASGNPLKDANGKVILETNEITVAPGGSTSSLTAKYSNITSAAQTITIPTYADTKQQDFTSKVPATGVITYDIGLNPLSSVATWNAKFPPAGTSTNPTVVRIINGSLNLPANINLSNYIIIVENGSINFNQGNPVINNVTLIANAGNINLNSVKGTSLSLSASGNINFSGNNQLTGNNIINSNGNAHFEGNISMTNTSSQVKVVAQGNIEISGNTSLKGQFSTKKDFSASGSTTIVGAITAMNNVDISGNSTITG
jgi:PKD repeat protein